MVVNARLSVLAEYILLMIHYIYTLHLTEWHGIFISFLCVLHTSMCVSVCVGNSCHQAYILRGVMIAFRPQHVCIVW